MRNSRDEEGFRRLVARQYGRISWAQLEQLDVRRSTIHRWERNGHLVRVLPRVYAVGHVGPSREADLWAAVLYAGPGAMLSHGTAAQLRGLIKHAPGLIEVSTPRKIKATGGVKVYGRRNHDRYFVRDLPVTSIPQTLVGGDNHSSRAYLHRDRENDRTPRRHGVTVHGYVWEQLREQGPRIRDEILSELS
jgi:predicted transcriptional regulator of viral defense system